MFHLPATLQGAEWKGDAHIAYSQVIRFREREAVDFLRELSQAVKRADPKLGVTVCYSPPRPVDRDHQVGGRDRTGSHKN